MRQKKIRQTEDFPLADHCFYSGILSEITIKIRQIMLMGPKVISISLGGAFGMIGPPGICRIKR